MFRSFAVTMLAGSCVVGCGWSGVSDGVAAVESEGVPLDSVGSAGAAATSVSADGVEPVREPSDVEEVDTVVEPITVERPSSIAVVGDSLTLSARDEIMSALASTGMQIVAVDGLESRRMTRGGTELPPGTAAIEQIRAESATDPGLWVVALGTNDVASVGSLDEFRSEMEEVLAEIPPDAPVVWVDLWIASRRDLVSRANLRIRAELSERDGAAAVVDWFSYGDDEGIITGDGVHLTDTGQQLFADSIVAAVEELFPTD